MGLVKSCACAAPSVEWGCCKLECILGGVGASLRIIQRDQSKENLQGLLKDERC